MSENEKIAIFADDKVVQELVRQIEDILICKDIRALDGITSLIIVMIQQCMTVGIRKASMLSYISNTWEVNDVENDHPLRKTLPCINKK
ncbi:MAG: hypothetical protein AABY22_07360 [Nanoarchaeota archaeon]